MTKKDYLRAASIVANIGRSEHTRVMYTGTSLESVASHAWTVREAFVTFFAGDNPRFDADRFREACGPVAKAHKVSQ